MGVQIRCCFNLVLGCIAVLVLLLLTTIVSRFLRTEVTVSWVISFGVED